jgi:hypothetical protein
MTTMTAHVTYGYAHMRTGMSTPARSSMPRIFSWETAITR